MSGTDTSITDTESEDTDAGTEMLAFHEHPLIVRSERWTACILCGGYRDRKYQCEECNFDIHKHCANRYFSKPFVCSHSLKICAANMPYEDCYFCRWSQEDLIIARCTICNISMHWKCVKNPPPVTIFQPKHHKHSLTLLPRLVKFTCNACGVEGDRNPYVCLECNFMVHKNCIDLPRVITINRHDHRISHTFHLGRGGDWNCGVCRKRIDWIYGGFKCSRCPSYAVHSKCATREEVWDGIELEDVPEEEEETEDPFKVLNETDIIHFSHEQHILRLDENYVVENDKLRYGGCISPIYDSPSYKCVECNFCLHKACANLPRKKRHLMHKHRLTLEVDEDEEDTVFRCVSCCQPSSKGFRYTCSQDFECRKYCIALDVRCSSISEPVHHVLHPHPLYFTLEDRQKCHACHETLYGNLFNCTECEYTLCKRCLTLPKKVKHKCDDHFLLLRQGAGNSSGDLWCDICETKTDPSVSYYTCDESGVCLHLNCVLGDAFYYMKVGYLSPGQEVVANNSINRPLCFSCKTHCKNPFFVRQTIEKTVRDFCSVDCLER